MPLSVLGEVVAGVVMELIGEIFAGGAAAGVDAAGEAWSRRAERDRERALASADIVVLAAWHDHIVTEAERHEIATRLEPQIRQAGLQIATEELIQRWSGPRAALQTDEAFIAAIRSLAQDLELGDRARTYRSVVAVLTADASRESGPGSPFRGRRPASPGPSIALFGEALGIPSETV